MDFQKHFYPIAFILLIAIAVASILFPRSASGQDFDGDVSVDMLGKGLIATATHRPHASFIGARKYYFAPNAPDGGDGSYSHPFMSLEAEVAAGTFSRYNRYYVLQHQGIIDHGDVCVLLEGNHGNVLFDEYYYRQKVALVGRLNAEVVIDQIHFKACKNFYIENIDGSGMTRNNFPEPGSGYDDGPDILYISSDDAGNYYSSNIIVRDCDFGVATMEEASQWGSPAQWNYLVPNAIRLYRVRDIHIQDCNFEVIDDAIHGDHWENVNLIRNTVSCFIGDGFSIGETLDVHVARNHVSDAVHTNENHNDGYQFWGTSTNLVFDRNFFLWVTEKDRDSWYYDGTIAEHQAVFLSSVPHINPTITNNIVITNSWAGIRVTKPTNMLVSNNTVVALYDEDEIPEPAINFSGYPLIDVSQGDSESTGVIANNICGNIPALPSGVISTSNFSDYRDDFSAADLVNWSNSLSYDTADYDLRPNPSSPLIGTGSFQYAPDADYDGVHRHYQLLTNIGAYESDHTDMVPPAEITGITVEFLVPGEVDIAWDASADVDILNYRVLRGMDSGNVYFLTETKTPHFTDDTVAEGVTYYYSVVAEDASHNTGDLAPPVGVSIPGVVTKIDNIKFEHYPIYANHMQGTYTSSHVFTSADYDSIAALDVYYPQMELFGSPEQSETYVGFVDSVRLRNPDIIVIDYLYCWGASLNWAGWDVNSTEYKLYRVAEDNDLWLRDTAGERVPYFWEAWNHQHLNAGHPDYADVMSTFYADLINASGNAQNFTGIYLDYFDYNYFANWACDPACQSVIDINQDGIPYVDQPEVELPLYQAGQVSFINQLRSKIHNKKFLIMSNGTAWRSEAVAEITEGGVWERMQVNNVLDTEAKWRSAVFDGSSLHLKTDLLHRPIILYDEQGNAPANEVPLIIASLATLGTAQISTRAPVDGRRFWTPMRSEHGKIDMGDWVEGGLLWAADEDTLYRQFDKGYLRMVPMSNYPYQYCLVDTVSQDVPDTLLISDNWPRATKPSHFNYGNYNQLAWSNYTNAVLDSIALLDVAEFHIDLFDERTPEITSQLKSRNSDIILLNYIPHWAVASSWASFPEDSYPRKIYDFIDDNDLWLRDSKGNLVVYAAAPTWRLVNIVGENAGNARLLAAYHSFLIKESPNLAANTGVFIDTYGVLDYPNWPCSVDCRDIIDLDGDGVAYYADPNEEDQYRDACEIFAEKLREYVNTEGFLVVSNGAGFHQSPDYAELLDGAMAENVLDGYYPLNKDEWNDLMSFEDYGMSTDILEKPLMMLDWEGEGQGQAEGALVALAMQAGAVATISSKPDGVLDGRRFWTPEAPHSLTGKVSLGDPRSNVKWVGAAEDTLYRQFVLGYVKTSPLGRLPFGFIVVDTVTNYPAEPDTLLISDNWPREWDYADTTPPVITNTSIVCLSSTYRLFTFTSDESCYYKYHYRNYKGGLTYVGWGARNDSFPASMVISTQPFQEGQTFEIWVTFRDAAGNETGEFYDSVTYGPGGSCP